MPKVFRSGIAIVHHQVEFPEGELDIRKWRRSRERLAKGDSMPEKKKKKIYPDGTIALKRIFEAD